MDESHLVSPKIKEYILRHKLEDKLNEAVNEVLRQLPEDPFSSLTNVLKNNSSSAFLLNKVELLKSFSSDFKQCLSMEITMTYKGNTRKCLNWGLTYNSKLHEVALNNLDYISNIFDKHYKHLVTEAYLEQLTSFDKILKGIYEDLSKIDHNMQAIAKLISNSISVAVLASQSIIQEKSLKNTVFENLKEAIASHNNTTIPNLGFSIFKCGKSMNSKVKFERFCLILNNANKLKKEELFTLVSKIYGSIRKVLTSGKQGELGMKLNSEGSYFTPNDTLNDTVKALEDIIKDTGESSRLSIGIDCNANNFFTESTKKYEMDGFKQPPDAEALIDYYLKYLSEHPLISYLEDPLASSDIQGWKKIYHKFQSKPNVTVACKSLINESLNSLKSHTQACNIEDTFDYMSEEEKHKINENNKSKSEENQHKLGFLNPSFRLNECSNLSELFECYQYAQSKFSSEEAKCGFTIWNNGVESDQSACIDIALGLRANFIMLHGINNRNESFNKINRYIELIEELY